MDDYNARNHEIFEILVSDLGSFHLFPRREWSWEFARADFENGRRPEHVAACTRLQPVEARNIKNDSRLSAQWRGCLSGEVFHKVAFDRGLQWRESRHVQDNETNSASLTFQEQHLLEIFDTEACGAHRRGSQSWGAVAHPCSRSPGRDEELEDVLSFWGQVEKKSGDKMG